MYMFFLDIRISMFTSSTYFFRKNMTINLNENSIDEYNLASCPKLEIKLNKSYHITLISIQHPIN